MYRRIWRDWAIAKFHFFHHVLCFEHAVTIHTFGPRAFNSMRFVFSIVMNVSPIILLTISIEFFMWFDLFGVFHGQMATFSNKIGVFSIIAIFKVFATIENANFWEFSWCLWHKFGNCGRFRGWKFDIGCGFWWFFSIFTRILVKQHKIKCTLSDNWQSKVFAWERQMSFVICHWWACVSFFRTASKSRFRYFWIVFRSQCWTGVLMVSFSIETFRSSIWLHFIWIEKFVIKFQSNIETNTKSH